MSQQRCMFCVVFYKDTASLSGPRNLVLGAINNLSFLWETVEPAGAEVCWKLLPSSCGALLLVLWKRSDPLLVVPVRLSVGKFALCVSCCQDADLPNLPRASSPVYSVSTTPDRLRCPPAPFRYVLATLTVGYKAVGM